MTDLHVDANISATGNITTTNSNLQAPQGSIYVQANVVAAGQMFADGNIYGNASLFVTSANISGALAVDSIATDVYTYANGAPVPLNGTGYGNSNVAEFLPTYTGAISSNSLSIANDVIALGQGAGASGAAGIVAIGNFAGTGNGLFSTDFVAIGNLAGSTGTGNYSVSIGANAGSDYAGANAVLIGHGAGADHGVVPGINMVAIGAFAGSENQGNNAVAIGYLAGANNQSQNSIVINATGNALQGGFAGTYIAPIRENSGNITNGLYYNVTTKEVTYGATGNAAASYGNANVELLLSNGTLGVSIIPGDDNLYTLGNAITRWSNIYTGSSVVIKGEDLTVDAGGALTYNGLPVIIGDANGNITAPYFFGDGSGLTGGYGNANVEIYLPDYAGDLPSVGNIVSAGNVTADYYTGNGSQLTGMYDDANVAAYLPNYTGNLDNVTSITATANISATNLTVTGESNLGAVTGVTITGGNVGEVLTTNGSGDLTWQAVDLNIVPPVYLTAPIAGNNQVFSNTILASYNSNVEMTVFYNGSLLENTNYTLAGDQITVNIPLAVGDGIDVVTTIASSVNSIVSSGYGNSNVAAYLPSYTGGFSSLTGPVTTTGNITANVFYGNGSQLTGIITVVPPINFTVAANGNNQSFTNAYLSSYSAPTDFALFYNGALLTADYYTLTGDVITINTPLVTGDNIDIPQQNVGNLTATITTGYGNSNVATFLDTGLTGNIIPSSDLSWTIGSKFARWASVEAGTIGATDDIRAGNLLSGATLNIDGDAVIAGNATILGNLTYNDVNNITTSNLVIGLGNTQTGILVTGGGMVVGNTAEASFTYNFTDQEWVSNIGIAAAGNITAANIGTTGQIQATGNITSSSNLVTTGTVFSSSANVTGNVTANVVYATEFQAVQANVANLTKLRFTNDGTTSYIQTGNGTSGSTGSIVFSPWTGVAERVSINTATGNLTASGNITASNVFSSQGKLLAATVTSPVTGQLLAYNGTTWVNSSTGAAVTGSWNVVPGEQTYSFDVPPGAAYNVTVIGNIPNGIITYQGQLCITNTNVAATGWWQAVNYSGGGTPIRFVQVPPTIGAMNSVINSDMSGFPQPSNTLRFVINNTSGSNQTVNWSYIKVL
jgi:hypothetical protein